MAASMGTIQPRDAAAPLVDRALRRDGADDAARGEAGPGAAVGGHLRRAVRGPAHRRVHRLGLGAVRANRVLDRRVVRRARDHPHDGRHGGGPLFPRRRTAPARGVASGRRTPPRGESWKSSASARKASACGSCTSTAPGATTSATRSPRRKSPRADAALAKHAGRLAIQRLAPRRNAPLAGTPPRPRAAPHPGRAPHPDLGRAPHPDRERAPHPPASIAQLRSLERTRLRNRVRLELAICATRRAGASLSATGAFTLRHRRVPMPLRARVFSLAARVSTPAWRPPKGGLSPVSSAILYVAIVVIWACVLIPRWLRRDRALGDNSYGDSRDQATPGDLAPSDDESVRR